jgi:alpha-1,3/alpha-1,6-mannosyltransferase
MDWWEELTTSQADLLLANSEFTAKVFLLHFPSIERKPRVVYPGINVEKYKAHDIGADVTDVVS